MNKMFRAEYKITEAKHRDDETTEIKLVLDDLEFFEEERTRLIGPREHKLLLWKAQQENKNYYSKTFMDQLTEAIRLDRLESR